MSAFPPPLSARSRASPAAASQGRQFHPESLPELHRLSGAVCSGTTASSLCGGKSSNHARSPLIRLGAEEDWRTLESPAPRRASMWRTPEVQSFWRQQVDPMVPAPSTTVGDAAYRPTCTGRAIRNPLLIQKRQGVFLVVGGLRIRLMWKFVKRGLALIRDAAGHSGTSLKPI